MSDLAALLSQGKLDDAIAQLSDKVRNHPTDVTARGQLIELLCLDGQLERADQQLNLLVQQHPECLTGAWTLRLLIRAQQARIDFHAGGATAELFQAVGDDVAALLALNLARQEGDSAAISAAAEALEQKRAAKAVALNNQPANEVRDIDDTLAGFVELFGTDGKFYLVRLAEISSLALKPATSLVETIWRPVTINISNGPEGDAFLPLTYVDSQSGAEKLGRATDWQELTPTVYRGRGLKTWLVGEEAMPLTQLNGLCAA